MTTLFRTVERLHEKIKFHDVVDKMDPESFEKFLRFRAAQIEEELTELYLAIEEKNYEQVLDALVDLSVFAAGTATIFTDRFDQAADDVMQSNFRKEVGIKPERPNPFGFPDLIKPAGWTAPDLTVYLKDKYKNG